MMRTCDALLFSTRCWRMYYAASLFCSLQGGSEKLGDEDLEMVLDKLVRLLAYISGKYGMREVLGRVCRLVWRGAGYIRI